MSATADVVTDTVCSFMLSSVDAEEKNIASPISCGYNYHVFFYSKFQALIKFRNCFPDLSLGIVNNFANFLMNKKI